MENQKRWQINVQKDGIRRSFTSSKPGRTGQREANAKADAWLDGGVEGGNEKIFALYDEYINYIKANGTRSNWQPAESKGNAWIIPAIGNKKIQNVTEQDLQAILDKAHSLGKSRKTIMNIRGTLVNFFKFCKRNTGISTVKDCYLVGEHAFKNGIRGIILTAYSHTGITFGKPAYTAYIAGVNCLHIFIFCT